MKKLFFLVVALFISIATFAQSEVNVISPQFTQNPNATYRLFPTRNMYNFIELNTVTGQMNLVQWSTKSNQGKFPLSNQILLLPTAEAIPGRFTLYSTTNIYNFVLLDQIDGRAWQVQWGTNSENNMVLPLY